MILNDEPAEVDVSMTQGDDWNHYWSIGTTVTNEDGSKTFTPWDLTGWIGNSQIRSKNADADAAAGTTALATLTVTIPDQTANPGRFIASLPASESVTLPNKEVKWDLELIDPSGKKRTYMAGTWTASREDTRV